VLPRVDHHNGMMARISQTDAAAGVRLVPVSSILGSGVILNTADISAKFNDAQPPQFEKVAPYVLAVELEPTSITDAWFGTLAKFAHLRSLDLEGTAATGQGLANLTELSQLRYLSLNGTNSPGQFASVPSSQQPLTRSLPSYRAMLVPGVRK
jgi:hypothetical protein